MGLMWLMWLMGDSNMALTGGTNELGVYEPIVPSYSCYTGYTG